LAAAVLALLLPGWALAQDLQGTLKKIKDSGTIAIGYREQSVPFSFRGNDGKPAGYSIDLCQRIVTGVPQPLKLPMPDDHGAAVWAALQKAFVTAQIVPVKDHREGLTALEGGNVDAYASDRVILIGLAVTAKDPAQFAISEQYLSYEPYGLMLRRGDAPFRL